MVLPRIYLDNAATSWPKPESVYAAVDEFQRTIGAAAGRGAYQSSLLAANIIQAARDRIQRLLNVPESSEVVFTFSATDGLNLCLFGLLRPGDHVITTVVEHNSVLRPLMFMEEAIDLEVTYLPVDGDGYLDGDDIRVAMQPNTRMLVVSHASNVTGAIQELDQLSRLARSYEILLLVDAAQTAGSVPIDLELTPVDMLVASGHKGLFGPTGTGIVIMSREMAPRITPIRFGGTGSDSRQGQPETGWQRFESGNYNMPGVVGLSAGTAFLLNALHDGRPPNKWGQLVLERMSQMRGISIVGPKQFENRVELIAFTVDGFDPHDVARILESTAGIEVRAGLHCAPRIHESLKLPGTVRASWSSLNTEQEITLFCDEVERIARSIPV